MNQATMKPRLRRNKRFLDLALAVPALIVVGPTMGLAAVLIRLQYGSPVLFRQQRPGLGGAPFILYKFRTMTDARNADGDSLPDAQRTPRFGELLRRTSLDELPELINVLKGEMSLVGPRPLLMEYLDRYNPEQKRRHEVLPGLTGLAQVAGRNNLSWEERFELDVWYVDHQSTWIDMKILGKTVAIVLSGRGVSGPSRVGSPNFMGSDQLPRI
jgi:lipopolysaccharide/colanic/teichoic acid biosynthesis glycosyltransferase